MRRLAYALVCLWTLACGGVSGPDAPLYGADANGDPFGPTSGDPNPIASAQADATTAPAGSTRDGGLAFAVDASSVASGYASTGAPGETGPRPVTSYEAELTVPLGKVLFTVWYPADARAREQFPLVPIAPGASFTKESMIWVGSHLASHGYIAITITPTVLYGVDVTAWGQAVINAIDHARDADANPKSPIHQRLDPGNIGVLGYSAGGGGAMVASELDAEIDTVVGLAPAVNLLGTPDKVQVPFIEICGDLDTLVSPQDCTAFYDRQDADLAREMLFVVGSDHWVNTDGATANNTLPHQALAKRTFTAWFNYYLKGQTGESEPFLTGPIAADSVRDGKISGLRRVR